MQFPDRLFVFVPLAVLSVALGCSGTTTYESYRPVKNRNVDIAYVAASADFSKYDRLMVDEMGIFFPTHASPSETNIARVRAAFRGAFIPQISAYEIVEKPASDVLMVRASLVDLRNTAMDRLPSLSDDINEILRPYRLTFVIELSDSKTGNVLLRAADTEKSPVIDLPDDDSAAKDDVTAAAEHWAQLLRNFLDKNLRGID